MAIEVAQLANDSCSLARSQIPLGGGGRRKGEVGGVARVWPGGLL